MDGMADTASALTLTMVVTPTCSAPTTRADTTMPMDTAATTTAATVITATLLRITTAPDITDGLTIRGPRRFITVGAGAERPGMAITVLTTRPIRSIPPRHSG